VTGRGHASAASPCVFIACTDAIHACARGAITRPHSMTICTDTVTPGRNGTIASEHAVIGVAGAATAPVHAMTAVAGAATAPVHAMTAVAGAATAPVHAMTAVAGAATAPMHAMTAVAGAVTAPVHAMTAVAGAATAPVHAMTAVAGAATAPAHAMTAVAGAATAPAHAMSADAGAATAPGTAAIPCLHERMAAMPETTFSLADAIAVLARTPASLYALLDGLPETWTRATEGEGTWSPYDVMGHLLHGERANWIPRARHILAGETRPFDPFDREAQFRASQGKTLSDLLGTFAELRRANIDALLALNLTANDLAREGRHPDLGKVTLGQLVATWVVHDLDHIAQVTRTMAKAYTAATGPWNVYLSILRDRLK
jgi:DinB family protein